MNINDFRIFRYSITNASNGSPSFKIQNAIGRFSISMAATYSELIEKHKTRLLEESNANSHPQIVRNHLTALRGLLRSIKKNETTTIGSEFTTGFAQCVKDHLASATLSERSKSDRKSLLTAWKSTYEQMKDTPDSIVRGRERRTAEGFTPEQTPFEKGLKSALKAAKLTPKTAARLAKVSTSALGRWSRGALPNGRSANTLEKVDFVLDLAPGTLTSLLRETHGVQAQTHANTYRERIRHTQKLSYALKAKDISPQLLTEWRKLFEHKTKIYNKGLLRQVGGRWSMADVHTAARSATPINSTGNMVAASADLVWSHVSRFLGFIRLPENITGFSFFPGATDSLAWLAVPEVVEAYLEFQTERAGGLKHGGHRVFCSQIAALTNPAHGYLVQSPDLVAMLPAAVIQNRPWNELCGETFRMASAWKADSDDVSRAPEAPLQFFLTQEFPLAPIFAAMRKRRAQASNASGGSVAEAIARRDEVLIGFLIANPLRAKNVKALSYKADNTGNVYQTHTGDWRIRIPGRQFKNQKRVGKTLYDVPVARWLSKIIDDYVRHFRNRLIADADDSGYFFVSSHGGGIFKSLNNHIYALTKALIPQCGGISPHAFRHLVATDWLMTHPNDFLTVAELLNDTLAVVLKDYVHLKKDVAFSRYETHIEKFAPRY